jgi:hypothetical protein
MSFVAFFLIATFQPPGFPQLPSGYGEWTRYGDTLRFFPGYNVYVKYPKDETLPYNLFTSCLKPYRIKIGSLQGYAEYRLDSTSYCEKPPGMISIGWQSHEKDSLTYQLMETSFIKNFQFWIHGYLALDNTGIQSVTIDTFLCFRLRAYLWVSQCDGSSQSVSTITGYYIPTDKFDFTMLCSNTIYTYDHTFIPPENCIPEEEDSLTKAFQPVHIYPNNIRELEQAVEQTFRVKE